MALDRSTLEGNYTDWELKNMSDEDLLQLQEYKRNGDNAGAEKLRSEKYGFYGGKDGTQHIRNDGSDTFMSIWDQQYLSDEQKRILNDTKAQEKAGHISTGTANQVGEFFRKDYNYSGGKYGDEYHPFTLADGNEKFSYKAAPSYVNSNADRINSMYNELINRGKFSYNAESDPLYQNYADQYTRNGSRAMQDTLAQISSRTGGLASSYAGTAAQQTYGNYMQALNDKIPELYQLAYSMWRDEGNEMRDNLNLLRDMDRDEFEKYKVQLGQFNTDRAFANDNYWNDLSYNNNIAQQQLAKNQWDQEFKWNQEAAVAQIAAQLLQNGISPSVLKQYVNFNDGGDGGLVLMSSDGTSIGTDSAEYTSSASATGTVVSTSGLNEGAAAKAAETAAKEIQTTDAPTPTISAQAQEDFDYRHFADLINGEGGSVPTGTGTSGGSGSSGYRSFGSMLSGSSATPAVYAGGKASKKGSGNSYSYNYAPSGDMTLPEGVELPSGKNIQWIDMLRASTGYNDRGVQKTMHISSIVGPRNPVNAPKASRNHKGTDITMPENTPVQVLAAGTVIRAGWSDGYGNLVEIQGDDGYIYRYAHNNKLLVKAGDRIEYGDTVSLSGNTGNSYGPHLHFEVRDAQGNALDGRKWIEAYTPEPEEKEEAGAQGAAAANGGKSSAELPTAAGSAAGLAGGIVGKAKDAAKNKGKEFKESYKKVKKGETESQKKTKKKPKQNVSSTTGKEITSNSKEKKKINKNKTFGKLARLTKAAAAAKKAGKK